MKVLDCESIESTSISLGNITGIEIYRIKDFLLEYNLEDYFAAKDQEKYPNVKIALFELFKKEFTPKISIDYVFWFHLTRNFGVENKYKKHGILPLNLISDSLFDDLYNIASKHDVSYETWEKFKKDLETNNCNHYTSDIIYKKLNNKQHWGPYAILIKDIALTTTRNSNIGYTYLRAPEIVEQICIAFKDELGIDLLEDYRKESIPIIVKFKDENLGKRDKYENYFMTALYFFISHCTILNLIPIAIVTILDMELLFPLKIYLKPYSFNY